MKIAVIDEGVIPVFKDELNIIEDLMVNSEGLVVNRPDDVPIITDHGLNVCKIINMHAPDAEIISIRIFSTLEMKTSIENLIAAFKYCLDENIPIIHLSGGTVNLFDDYLLRDVIKKLINNNQIVVAAHNNSKGLSFPALYPYVFSSRASELFITYHQVNNRWGYSFLTPSKHNIRINDNLSYVTSIANSYAAPVLTAQIYKIIISNGDNRVNTIFRNLGEVCNIFLCELPSFLDRATIVNLGDEVIIEEVLSFHVRNIHNNINFNLDSRDYIFIPHRNNKINIKKLKEFLKALSVNTNRTRIFYLSTRDGDIDLIINYYPFEFWLLPSDEIYPICVSNTDLNACATIYFQGNKEVVYYIMAQLRDAFLEDGFNCFAISDCLEATLYGIYYFKDLANSTRRQQLEYALEPDVELVYAKVGVYKEIANSMLIEVIKENGKIKLLISAGNTKEEVGICCEEDIKKLFARIVKIE